MNHKEIIQKFLEFFKSKGHEIMPSASLMPENDPTVLFTTAGMHPLVPFLIGQPHPLGKRLANNQKCLRTGDIEEVGDAVHHTFFEMLGNWSLGDYFKKEAIEWSYEFLTSNEWLGLDRKRMAVSCFEGDDDAPKDEEAAEVWRAVGIPEERIAFLPKKENWWGPAGESGPCGPDTEMFYWASDEPPPEKFDPEDGTWVEIWNDVFLQYNKEHLGKFVPLAQKNVDTGMGLERTTAALQGFDDNYKTELFIPIISKIEEISGKRYDESKEVKRSMRIIADHLRAAVFVMGDGKGILPSNVEHGYVLRRLIRRAIRYGMKLGVGGKFCHEIVPEIIEIYRERYPELERNRKFVIDGMENEEEKFSKTIQRGMAVFEKIVENMKKHGQEEIPGKTAFKLYDTHGFPYEMTAELAKEQGLKVDREGFLKAFKRHQELSRQAAAGKFKSGLADQSDKTIRLHTATHLLHEALRRVLGEHVNQKGSNITPERLRFDFSHPEKMTKEQIQKVEDLVNEQIEKGLEVQREEMSIEEAKEKGALAFFDAKYEGNVSVYSAGDFSMEVCTGPHVKNTKEIGRFKIKKEESSAAGIRRIKAVVE